MADLARVELPGSRRLSPEEKLRWAREQAGRERIHHAATKLEVAERSLRLEYRDLIHRSEAKQREVRARLAELATSAEERDRVEGDDAAACWGWLAALTPLLREYVAGYWVLAFGSARDRAHFALRPDARPAMINQVLSTGGVVDDDGKFMEV